MKLPALLSSLAIAVLLSGCASSPEPHAAAGNSAPLSERISIGQSAVMDVESGQITPAPAKAPRKPYIEGTVTAEGFQPTSQVLGKWVCLCGMEKYTHDYTTGWRDLRTGKFIEKTRDTRPERPYLLGQINELGEFYADSRVVVQ